MQTKSTEALIRIIQRNHYGITDLARRAGVSRGMIYSILKGGHYIADDTRERVWVAAVELIAEKEGGVSGG